MLPSCSSTLWHIARMILARGSKFLYTRWPKPMSRKWLDLSFAIARYFGMFSTVPICSSIDEHGFVRAAVRRAPQRRNARGNRRVGIRARAAGEAHGGGAGVLLVIGMQHEQQVERLRRHRIELVRLARHGEEHVQHVAAVVEIVARIDERLAERMLVRGGGDGRDLRDDAVREDLALARVMDVHRVVIERGHRGDHRRHHRHRVRVVVEAVEEAQQRLVDHRVMTDVGGELVELLLVRQIAVQQQVRHLHERALLGELLDGVAAIQQHAGVAVDVGDAAVAWRR